MKFFFLGKSFVILIVKVFIFIFYLVPKYYFLVLINRRYLTPLSMRILKNKKKSDTLFILGSGASINNYDEKMWKDIQANDSIGLNNWVYHDFIPTYFSFEWGRVGLSNSKFIHNFKLRINDYKETVIIFRDLLVKKQLQKESFVELPRGYRIYSPVEFVIPGKKPRQFEFNLKILSVLNIFALSYFDNFFVAFKKRASIDFAVFFGYKLGYKTIVLCGVDLNNTNYFFEIDKYKDSKFSQISTRQKGDTHSTIDQKVNPIGIDFVINKINEYVLKPKHVKLYTALESSLLSKFLPVYFNDTNNKQ